MLHGRRSVFELKGLVDDRLEAVLRVEIEHRPELLVGAHRGAEHVEVLEGYADSRHLRCRARRRPEDDDAATGPGERDEGVEALAADVVHREIHAAGNALELLAPALGVVVDAALRPELLRLLDLLVAPGGDEDPRPESRGHLHHESSYPAPDTRHDDRLALLYLATCDERPVGCQGGERYRR